MGKETILVVEDEIALAELLCTTKRRLYSISRSHRAAGDRARE